MIPVKLFIKYDAHIYNIYIQNNYTTCLNEINGDNVQFYR